MIRIALLVLLSFLTYGCSVDRNKHEFDPEKTQNEVRAMLGSYHQAIKERGLTGEFGYLDSTSDFFWVPPGYQSALTYDSVKLYWKGTLKGFHRLNLFGIPYNYFHFLIKWLTIPALFRAL